jgi:hypothetical protein
MTYRSFLLLNLFLVFFSANVQARRSGKHTPLQETISKCFKDQIEVKGLRSLKNIYDLISKKQLLVASVVLNREVLYKIKDESRKLKYEDGKLQIYKILDDQDDQLSPIDNDVRQKSLTVEAYLSQLLLQADIRSDYMKIKETRISSTTVYVARQDDEIKTLVIENEKLQKKLDCSRSDNSVVCSCSDIK